MTRISWMFFMLDEVKRRQHLLHFIVIICQVICIGTSMCFSQYNRNLKYLLNKRILHIYIYSSVYKIWTKYNLFSSEI